MNSNRQLSSKPLSAFVLATWFSAASAFAGTSTAVNPTVTFATPGNKQVDLMVCNAAGCNSTSKTALVLDPTPVVASALASPQALETGELIRLVGSATGRPPLTYTWRLFDGGREVASASGANAWLDTSNLSAGNFTLKLAVSNTAATVESTSIPIEILPSTLRSFFTLPPCRILDTRTAAPIVAGAAPRVFTMTASDCGVPATAKAISANITVTQSTGRGEVIVYPGNYPRPTATTVGFEAGITRANNQVLALASDGTATVAAEALITPSGSVHFIVDVNGYFE